MPKFYQSVWTQKFAKKRGNQSSLVTSKVVDWFKISGFSDLSVIKIANCSFASIHAIIVKGKKRSNAAGQCVSIFLVS